MTHSSSYSKAPHSVPLLSASFGVLVAPEGHLPVVAAGSQQPGLLGVPGHAVHILGVSLLHEGGQAEGGLVGVCLGVLLKHSDGVVSAGGGQSARQVAPAVGGRKRQG